MRRALFPLAAVAFLAASAASAAIRVEDARIRVPPPGALTAAAYMTLRNTGSKADILAGASCPCAGEAIAHETVTTKGIARMRMAQRVALPPGGAVAFEPAGRLHLMLTDLKRPIHAGETVPITLRFVFGGPMTVRFKAVADPAAR